MVGLVIDAQSLRLEGIGGDVVASFLSARDRHLDVRPHGSDAAQSTSSRLRGGGPVGSVQL